MIITSQPLLLLLLLNDRFCFYLAVVQGYEWLYSDYQLYIYTLRCMVYSNFLLLLLKMKGSSVRVGLMRNSLILVWSTLFLSGVFVFIQNSKIPTFLLYYNYAERTSVECSRNENLVYRGHQFDPYQYAQPLVHDDLGGRDSTTIIHRKSLSNYTWYPSYSLKALSNNAARWDKLPRAIASRSHLPFESLRFETVFPWRCAIS